PASRATSRMVGARRTRLLRAAPPAAPVAAGSMVTAPRWRIRTRLTRRVDAAGRPVAPSGRPFAQRGFDLGRAAGVWKRYHENVTAAWRRALPRSAPP